MVARRQTRHCPRPRDAARTLQDAQDARDRGSPPSRAGCRARSAARRPPSRARRPTRSRAIACSPDGQERRLDRPMGTRRGTPSGTVLPVPAGGSTPRRIAATPRPRTRTSAASRPRRAAATACGRRSGTDRAGSPSKSRISQSSSSAPERLAEVVVAVVPDHAADRADVGQQAQPVAHLLAAAGDRRERGPMSGSVVKTCSISSSTDAESSASASALGSSGAKCGSLGSEPSACAAPRSPRRAGARAPAASRARTRACRAPAPSRRPAGGHEALQDRERRVHRPALVARPPSSAAMCSKPRSVRKRSSSSSGFMPGSSRR